MAALSLMIETYNKGVAALPLVLVLLVAGSFIWYLARVEPAADPVSGLVSTVFVFVWVGVFGSFAALLLDPNLFPDRHGIAFLLAAVIATVADDIGARCWWVRPWAGTSWPPRSAPTRPGRD